MTRGIEDLFAAFESNDEEFSKLNSYLALTYLALTIADKPLRTSEILDIARKYRLLPGHLYGKTPHKTLNARLSEHIRAKGAKSLFFRTAPATYFLSKKGERYGVFRGVRRHKAIKPENVLVAPRAALEKQFSAPFSPFDGPQFEAFKDKFCFHMNRIQAEKRDDVKQFVTFTLFYSKGRLLIYRRGNYTTASEELRGALSVGFGGHINDGDFDLFDHGGMALINNSARELMEELYLYPQYKSVDEVAVRSTVLGFINVDASTDARHHIAALIRFEHKSSRMPSKGEQSITDLKWLDLSKPLNDLSKFDLWSRMILHAIFSKQLQL